jgi:UDP-N-acetylmuramoyl-tripeptide--D-alanyl-D-alanine ligase
MRIEELYSIFIAQQQKICTDTRKVEQGAIYFALKGDNFDANDFALQALSSGCSYAVVDKASVAGAQCILVADVLATLQALALYHRQQLNIPVIGITGSNGKTTTKELVKAVLDTQFKVHCTKGNLNNHIGVPLTLLSMPLDTELAIIEMGANHPLEIEFLCGIAAPNYGMVTNIGKAHLEGFGGFEGVIKTKSEMYQYVAAHTGKVFVNASDALLMKQSAMVGDRILYQSDVFFGTVKALFPSVHAELHFNGQCVDLQTHLFGEHNLINMVAAAAVGNEFSVSPENIQKALTQYQPDNNRSQIKKSAKGNMLILDAYNANPSSMRLALLAFAKVEDDNKFAIVGDMLELGEAAAEEHQAIVNLLREQNLKAYLVGVEFEKCADGFKSFASVGDLKAYLSAQNIDKCTVLIKGSRGIKLELLEEVL